MHQTSEDVCLLALGWQSTGGAPGRRWQSRAAGGAAAGTGNADPCRESAPMERGKRV